MTTLVSVSEKRLRLVEVALWVLVTLLAARFALFSIWAAARLSNGFAAHYTASRLLLGGADVARFYDESWFAARIGEIAGPVYDLFSPNLPPAALLLLPVAWLDYPTARAIWTVTGLVALAITALFLMRQLRLEGAWRPAFLAGVLLFQPIYEQVAQGQNYLLILAALTAAWHGYRLGSARLTGIALGAALGLKLAGGYVGLLLLLERRWTSLAWTAGTVGAVAALTLPFVGPAAWTAFLGGVPAVLGQPDIAITAHQTQTGFLRHMLAFDARYNQVPLVDASALAPVAVWAAFAAMLGITLYAAGRAPGTDLAFALMVLLNVILGPLSADYQYTVTLLPVALLLGWVRARGTAWSWVIYLAGVALIAADLPYRSPRLSGGAWALLAYPKLYGAWLLWGLAVWGCVRASVYQRSAIGRADPVAGR